LPVSGHRCSIHAPGPAVGPSISIVPKHVAAKQRQGERRPAKPGRNWRIPQPAAPAPWATESRPGKAHLAAAERAMGVALPAEIAGRALRRRPAYRLA